MFSLQLAEWIRGSECKETATLREKAVSNSTFRSGQRFNLSTENWRMLVRHAWLSGLLRREMKRGVGNRMVNGVIFNVFHLTDTGSNFLPAVGSQKSSKSNVREDKSDKPKTTRKGMGSQALSTIRRLMSSSDQWFTVNSSSSYHLPGVFHSPFPQRMGFCPDITQLPSYEKSDPDFIFTDIQLGKGKARNQREIVMNIDSQEEAVLYRIVPCGGVIFVAESRAEQQGPGSVQIHHNGSHHWVVSTMRGRDVLLYDSRYTGEALPDALKVQLLEVYGSSVKRVLFPRVKQQEGEKTVAVLKSSIATCSAKKMTLPNTGQTKES